MNIRPHVIWAATVMVIAILGTLVLLARMDADTSMINTIIGLVNALVTAVLFSQVQAVKTQTNGNTSEDKATIRAQLDAANRRLESSDEAMRQLLAHLAATGMIPTQPPADR